MKKLLLLLALCLAPALFAQAAPDVSKTVTVGAPVIIQFDSASGTNPFTFQWLKDGTFITGATLPQINVASAPMAAAGVYTCQVSNSAGSTISNKATLIVTPAAVPPGSATIKFASIFRIKTPKSA